MSPRSSRAEVERQENRILKVRVKSPSVDNRANAECLKLLAQFFHVPVTSIRILAGHHSRRKRIGVEVDGYSKMFLTRR